MVEQLTRHVQECPGGPCPGGPGPPTRKLIGRCLATLFSVGDTFLLFDTVNKAAICCVGYMYEKLGRMMGRSYEETVQILVKSLRNAESQTRIEIMITLEKVCSGMGTAISNVHKEIYKAARHCLTDRVMAVRCAAARCLLEMLNHAPFLYLTELEGLATLCFRAFDGSNYEVRCAVARLLGALVATTQQPQRGNQAAQNSKAVKSISLEEALGVLMTGFLRGGTGFLKGTGEMIKGSSGVNREVRVGVTHAYVVFVQILGGAWLERNLGALLSHVLDLVANPKAASSHVDAVYSRKCISFILRSVLGRMLGEKAQASAAKEIAQIILKQMNSIDFNPENAKDCNQETLFGQHLLVCALQELGALVLGLGTTAAILLTDQSLSLVDAAVAVLVHPCQAARLAAAWALRCICVAVPAQSTPLIDKCVEGIENMRTSPEAIGGYSAALAAVLGGVRLSPLGVPHTKGKVIFNTAEELLRSASQNSRLSLNRTQAGWLLIGAIMTLGVPVVRGLLPRMLLLWRNSFPRSNKELESEKARGDAFTWQVTLEGRAGALSAMHSFVQNCPELVTDDITRRLLTPIESALAMLTNISNVLKTYGQHLKAPSAMVRLRLYETLALLPPTAFEGSYTHLLRMLVAEFTLTENSANTTTSLLRAVCHADDSVILGTWLQETDHRTIEDQMEPNHRADGEHVSVATHQADSLVLFSKVAYLVPYMHFDCLCLLKMAPANQGAGLQGEVDLLGEGGAGGELPPGHSLVFAALEVCLCLLVRALPALNPTPIVSPVSLARPQLTPQHAQQCGQLVAAALGILEDLPGLCSPKGAVAILPTVLYLTTGVMRECATSPAPAAGAGAGSSVSAALRTLRSLCSSRLCRDERCEREWQQLLTSALAKIIDLAKTGSDEAKLDEVTMLLAIAVFVLHAPVPVVCAPNLLYPCINQFRHCMQSQDFGVRLKCLQTLRSLFAHPDRNVSTPYIHMLAPRVMEFLYAEESKFPRSDVELALVLECIQIVDTLISLTETKNRVEMLALLVPVLISFLLEGPALKDASKPCQTLHERSLQWLMKIGPQYPQEFKSLMAQSTEMRTKLESAIRTSQQAQQRVKVDGSSVKPLPSQTPTIKLKTDFSNFTA
ncbi:hypothetical protein FOCC_FOCC002164 [Frankliniella occidentalis]|nr:hypothetical protein FOCC_FOCC002164 [Frankliniella occidentalis]